MIRADGGLSWRSDGACALVVSVLAALNFLPTLGGGLADADGYLQHISAIAGFDAETNSAVYGQLVHYYRSVQPGWFPLGPAALAIWLVDPGPFLARLLQLAIVLLTFATFAIVARRLFGSSRLAISASVAALALWQLRMPHDPVIGTSFQAPVLAESVLLAYASWYTYGLSRNVFWLWLTCAAAAVASLTDPIGFVLMFALAGMAPLETATRVQSLLVVCTVAIVAVISISHGSLDPPWNRSFYASDVTAQLVAPFPGTYRAFGNVPIGHVAALSDRGLYADDRFDAIPGPSVLGWLFVTGCTVAAALFASRWRRPTESGSSVPPGPIRPELLAHSRNHVGSGRHLARGVTARAIVRFRLPAVLRHRRPHGLLHTAAPASGRHGGSGVAFVFRARRIPVFLRKR